MKRFCKPYRSFAILLVLLAAYRARAWWLPVPAIWLDVGKPPARADAVMVLGGDPNARPFVAAALVREGFAERALVPRQAPSPEEDAIVPPEHELTREALIRKGVRGDRVIFVGAGVRSTFDEAQALAAFLDSEPDCRVLVVTSNYHTRRSRWVFGRVLGPRLQQVRFVSAPVDRFRLAKWWRSEWGFVAILTENLKFLFYVARYGGAMYWAFAVGIVGTGLIVRRYWRVHSSIHRPEKVTVCHAESLNQLKCPRRTRTGNRTCIG